MSNAILAKMAVEISANNAKFGAALSKSQRELATFTKGVTGLAKTLGIAFGVQQAARFTLEISKLAGEAQGVNAAFERLPQSIKLMEDLKAATGGTVSELDLMKRAVQASNFDISLASLPKLLEFATLRAQQTGQSVDYLVDSIVTGIGRKSKLILDNLGISAVQLDKALGGVSVAAASVGQVADAVGTIAEENLKNMAGFAENASTKIQRLSASYDNLKVALGGVLNDTGILGSLVDYLAKGIDTIAKFAKEGIGGPTLEELQKMEKFFQSGQNEEWRKFKSGESSDLSQWKRFNDALRDTQQKIREITKSQGDLTKEQQSAKPTTDQLTMSVKQLMDQWDRQNSIFAKQFSAKGQIKDKTGADFLFDSGAMVEMANAPSRALEHLNKSLLKHNETFLESNDIWISGWRARMEIAEQAAAKEAEWLDKLREKYSKQAEIAQTVGVSLGDAFASIATGQEDALRSMARATEQIIEMLLRQSIAAMIAASMKDPTTPLPFAKIAIAAAGIGAVRALFSQIGGGAGGGGGVSTPGRLPSESGNYYNGGRSRIVGYDLLIVDNKNSYRRERIG